MTVASFLLILFDAERRELFRTSGADAVIGKLGATYE